MSNTITFEIGAIPIALVSVSQDCFYGIPQRFEKFRKEVDHEVRLNVHCGDIPNIDYDKKIFDTTRGWSMYQYQDKWLLWAHSPMHEPFQLGVFADDFRSGDIYVRADSDTPDKFNFPLGRPIGEIYIINLLGRSYGACLHACGVIDQGQGLVFAGYGGAGKSTTARIWQDHTNAAVLNDDRLIVRYIDGVYWVYGTPWHGLGGVASPAGAPLEKIFILKQGNENQAKRLSPAAAASELLVRSVAPFWDHRGMEFTLGFLSDLCQQIPCYELNFLPEPSMVDFVQCL